MSKRLLTLTAMALLASPAVGQIGSVGSQQDLGNMYITGQVTGGFSFRGQAPYAGVNELSLRLPSEMIDDFQRDSIGLDRLQGGRSYRPQAFTPASRATYMLRAATRRQPMGMAGGMGVTGVVAPVVSAVGPSTGASAGTGAAFSPILTRTEMAGVLSRTEPAGPVMTPAVAPSVVVPVAGERPGVSALFGMMQETQRRQLTEQMLDAEALVADGEAEPPVPDGATEGANAPGARGEDVFADMLVDLTDLPEEAELRPGPFRGSAPSANLERLDVDPGERVLAQRSRTTLIGDAAGRLVLRSLGGHGTDKFNRLMAEGDRLLAAGRFYLAASRYENARVILGFNTLPAIGAGLAYLGAGESYRASYYLRLGIRMFPDLVKFRVDIDKLLGKKIVDKRLAELPGQLSDEPNAENMPVLFLLTFIHANRGQMDEARTWAEQLAPLVEPDPRLRAYARSFIGEPTPPTAPAEP